jgi:hypothetical protein
MAKDDKKSKLRDRIRRIVSAPAFNVSLLILLILSVTAVTRIFYGAEKPAQLNFVEKPPPAAKDREDKLPAAPPRAEIFSGEVYSTVVRLRETGALGLAFSLSVFAGSRGPTNAPAPPASAEAVLREMQARELMPPGIVFEEGALSSPGSVFIVHYRRDPSLAFEIYAFPKDKSPALMLRFPLISLDGRTITYFQTKSVADFSRPRPFASLKQLLSSGWMPEQWRGEIMKGSDAARKLLEAERKLWQSSGRN